MLRIRLSAFVLGTACVHRLAAVPRWPLSACGLALCVLAIVLCRRIDDRRWSRFAKLACLSLLYLLAGFALAAVRVDLRLADGLAADRENVPIQVAFRVSGLASSDERSQRFDATLIQAPTGVPRHVVLSWYPRSGNTAPMIPGQIWRARVVLKRPHGTLNPDGFDFEAYLFAQGIRATGNLRGTPRLIGDEPFADARIAVQRVRHLARAALQTPLQGARYGPVIIALAMGDQASVDKRDWRVFSRTGITHLVSISGMHVTMVAALAGAAVLAGWKRWSWRGVALPERTPAQIAAAGAALFVAWVYCLLAGWGVPAQRTFFMLAVVAGAAILRLPLSGSRVLVLATVLVCVLDPWAPLAAGFWLSFGAVAMLILAGTGRWNREPRDAAERVPRWHRWLAGAREACRLQLIMTVGMIPLVAMLFQQVSMVSPFANAIAIPVVSLIVTPLALVAMPLCALPGLEGAGAWLALAAHRVLELLMVPIVWLSESSLASHSVAAAPLPLIALACGGVVWALQPRGLPGRLAALLLLLPVLTYRPARPAPGDWRMTALDVGQGAAILIETANAALLFDTGPKTGPNNDAGDRVVWPYLRSRGIKVLQQMVVSHGDMDHAGGVQSILAALPVEQVRASYDLPATLAHERDAPPSAGKWTFTRCVAGQHWEYDGVAFAILHPASVAITSASVSKDRNAASCVLRVQGAHHSALLTGDIGLPEEQRLAGLDNIETDVVMAAHHGSRNASGEAFVKAVHATHAVAQAGYLNSFRHPHPDTVRRWQSAGSVMHRTDHHGAIVFESHDGLLSFSREREARRRVWHSP